MIQGTVDRDSDYPDDPDYSILVELDNGYKVSFWRKGLSDKEYIKRANQIMKLEQEDAR